MGSIIIVSDNEIEEIALNEEVPVLRYLVGKLHWKERKISLISKTKTEIIHLKDFGAREIKPTIKPGMAIVVDNNNSTETSKYVENWISEYHKKENAELTHSAKHEPAISGLTAQPPAEITDDGHESTLVQLHKNEPVTRELPNTSLWTLIIGSFAVLFIFLCIKAARGNKK